MPMHTSRRTPSLIGAAAAAALAVAGCGSSSSTSSSAATPASTPAPAAQGAAGPYAKPSTPAGGNSAAGPVALSADPTGALKFNVATLHAKAGSVTLTMSNPSGSGVAHGIAVQGNGVDKDSTIVRPGAMATVTATLKSGTYAFYCPVPGHEAAGMKGTLIVS